MKFVSMLLNSNLNKASGSSRARFARNSGTRFTSASVDFSRVLDTKISGDQVRQRTEFQLDVKQVEISASSAREADSRSARQFKQNSNGDNGQGKSGSAQSDRQSFFQQVAQDDEQSFRRVKDSNQSSQPEWSPAERPSESSSDSNEPSSRETVRDIIRDQMDSKEGTKEVEEMLSSSDRKVLEKIENGQFDLGNEEDVKQLKKLLEKFSQSDSARAQEKGIQVLKQLFGSTGNLQELLDENQSTEQLVDKLKNLQEILKKTQKLVGNLSDRANESVIDQLKQGFEKLKDGDDDDQSLTKLLNQIKDALKKESEEQKSGFQKALGELSDKVKSLIDRLKNQTGKGSSDGVKGHRESIQSLVERLNNRFSQLGGNDQSGQSISSETIRQYQQAIQTAEQQLKNSSLKEELARHLNEYSVSNKRADASGQSTDSASDKQTKNQSTNAKQSDQKASNQSKQSDADRSKGQSGQGDNASKAKTSSASSSGEGSSENAKQNQSAQQSGQSGSTEQVEKQAKYSAEKATGQSTESNQSSESTSTDSSEAKATDSSADKNNSKSQSAESLASKTAKADESKSSDDKNKQAKQSKTAEQSNSKQASTQASDATNNKSAQANQTNGQSSRVARTPQETLKVETAGQKVQNTTTSSAPDQVQQQTRQVREVLNEQVIDKTEKVSSEAKNVQGADADQKAAKEKSASSKHFGKMAQYESNSAQAVQSTDGSGAEFSNNGNQQQPKQGQASVKTQAARGSDFSERMREARKVIKQMVEKAQTMVDEGKQTMKLQLQPPELGQMKMSISLEGDRAKANVQVEKGAVKKLLDDNMAQLKQTLQGVGVDLDEVDISEYENDGNEADSDFWFDDGEGREQAGDEEEVEADPGTQRGHTRPTRNYSSIELVA